MSFSSRNCFIRKIRTTILKQFIAIYLKYLINFFFDFDSFRINRKNDKQQKSFEMFDNDHVILIQLLHKTNVIRVKYIVLKNTK